jgi:nucleoside-diphosphate-sugar epimerase
MDAMQVFIGGVASSTGRLLAEYLLARGAQVTGLDDRPCYPAVPGLRFVRAAYTQPEWHSYLAGVDAAVLLTPLDWPSPRRERAREAHLVTGAQAFVKAVIAAGVPRLVVGNNLALYGMVPADEAPLSEDGAVRGHEVSGYGRARARLSDWLELEVRPQYSGVLVHLRCAWLLGGRHTELIRHFRRLPVLVCGEGARALAVLHEDDALTAIAWALEHELAGVYHVASGNVALGELAALVGRVRPCVPMIWVMVRAWLGWRWRGWPTPPLWARALVRGPLLATDRLQATGWSPRHGPREALATALEAVAAAR